MTDITSIVAQGLGIIGIIVFLFCFHGKKMKDILKTKLLVDIIWGIHYLLLHAYTGFATNFVCCLRELVFMNKDKKVFQSKYWLIVFVAMNWIFSILTWKSYYSFLPAITSTLATISFSQKDVKRARIIALINNSLMCTYDIFVLSYAGIIAETLSFVSVLIALRRAHRETE